MQIAVVINFDLDEGQVVEACSPSLLGQKQLALLAMQAFPQHHSSAEAWTKLILTIRLASTPLLAVSQFVRAKCAHSRRGYYQKAFLVASDRWNLSLLEAAAQRLAIECTKGAVDLHQKVREVTVGAESRDQQPHLLLQRDQCLKDLLITADPFAGVDIVGRTTQQTLPLLWVCWESALLNQPVVVYSPFAEQACYFCAWVHGSLWPISFMGDFKPFMTVYDDSFETYREMLAKGVTPNLLAGVANPLFLSQFRPVVIDLTKPRKVNHDCHIKPPKELLKQLHTSSSPSQQQHASSFLRALFRRQTLDFIGPVVRFLRSNPRDNSFREFKQQAEGDVRRLLGLYERFWMSANWLSLAQKCAEC